MSLRDAEKHGIAVNFKHRRWVQRHRRDLDGTLLIFFVAFQFANKSQRSPIISTSSIRARKTSAYIILALFHAWRVGSLPLNGRNCTKSVWTVVQTVLTATFNSYGDRHISTPLPHKINTPEPIDKKIGTIDYIREGTSYTKFGRNPFTGRFWVNWWKIRQIIFLFIPFFLWSAYRWDP